MRGFLKKVKSKRKAGENPDDEIDWSMPDDNEDLTKVLEKEKSELKDDDDSDDSVAIVSPASPAFSTIRVLKATTTSRSGSDSAKVISEEKGESPPPGEDQLWVSERAERPADLGLDENSIAHPEDPVVQVKQHNRAPESQHPDPPTWPPPSKQNSLLSDTSVINLPSGSGTGGIKSRPSYQNHGQDTASYNGTEISQTVVERPSYLTVVERRSGVSKLGLTAESSYGGYQTVIDNTDTLHDLPFVPGTNEDPPTGLEAHPIKIRTPILPPRPQVDPMAPYRATTDRSDLSEMTLPIDKGPPLRSPPTKPETPDPETPDPYSLDAVPKNSISQLNLARIETDRSDAPVSLESPVSKNRGPNQVLKMQTVLSDESLPVMPLPKRNSGTSQIVRRSTTKLSDRSETAATEK